MNRRLLLKNLALSSLSTPFLAEAAAKPLIKNATPENTSVRFAHVTDVHIFPFISATRGFGKCLHHLQNLPVPPDFIINGGDAVLDAHKTSLGLAQRQWQAWHQVLKSENSLPVYHTLGNHDIWCKDNAEQAFVDGKKLATDELELAKPYYSFTKNNWKIIVLDSIQKGEGEKWYTAQIDQEQLHWLKTELKNTPKTQFIAVVSHVPILAACVFFDGKRHENQAWRVPDAWMHADMSDLTALFYKHPNVKLALSGHIHLRDEVQYNGLTYCCNGAVSGAWWAGNYQQTAQGYAVVDLFEDGTFKNQYVAY